MAEASTPPAVSTSDRIRWLQWAMRIFGVAFVGLAAFAGIANILALGVVGEGSFLEWVIYWRPRNLAYELTNSAMLVAWGLFLWKGAHEPQRHRFFIDFSIVLLGLHVLVLIYSALAITGARHHLITDIPLLAVVAVVLLLLRPKEEK